VLSFVVQVQEQKYWCWAAVAASVAAYYQQPGWTQCGVVNATRGFATCCQSGDSDLCDQPWYLEQALTKVGTLAQPPTGGYLPWSELTSELDAGRPVGVFIRWPSGGHFVAIGGYSASGVLNIQDPWYGASTVPYNTFLTAYQNSGSWTDSYLTTSVNYQPPTGSSSGQANDPWQPHASWPSATNVPSGTTVSPSGLSSPDPWTPRPFS
jgi:hypothetical protein